LKEGDLVFIYLAQDGQFQTDDNAQYGSLLSKSTNAGMWQINRITQVGNSGVVSFECDLNPAFNNLGHSSSGQYSMVVTRIMLADTLSISASITAQPFSNGGGIVAIIANAVQMKEKISADAAGFSGGTVSNSKGICYRCPYCSTANNLCSEARIGGQRGASIAPYSEDRTIRGNCRGALANGGGGGNNHNAAGGGGANVCANMKWLNWTGDGVSYHLIA